MTDLQCLRQRKEPNLYDPYDSELMRLQYPLHPFFAIPFPNSHDRLQSHQIFQFYTPSSVGYD